MVHYFALLVTGGGPQLPHLSMIPGDKAELHLLRWMVVPIHTAVKCCQMVINMQTTQNCHPSVILPFLFSFPSPSVSLPGDA